MANGTLAAILAWQQSIAILAAEDVASANEFAETIGAISTGMAPFNIAAAMVAPMIALLTAIALRHQKPRAVGIAAPSLITGTLALAFIPGSSAAEVSRIQSYNVLKALDASLLATVPLIAATIAAATVLLIRRLAAPTAIALVGEYLC